MHWLPARVELVLDASQAHQIQAVVFLLWVWQGVAIELATVESVPLVARHCFHVIHMQAGCVSSQW